MKQYYYIQKWRKFEEWIKEFHEEIGDTIFSHCQPVLVRPDIVEINIPEANHNRIRDTLNYAGCHLDNSCPYTEKNFQPILINNKKQKQ